MSQITKESNDSPESSLSSTRSVSSFINDKNPIPQCAPGASAAIGHIVENSIPLSIFPVAIDKHCIIFVGMPGRGKTHIARRLMRYLDFFHAIPVQVFHISDYRRRMCGALKDSTWFDSSNAEAVAARNLCSLAALDDMTEFMNSNSQAVGILDSTCSTHTRRLQCFDTLKQTGAKIMFVEVSNDDEKFLAKQCRHVTESSPDYQGIDTEAAVQDYMSRIAQYQQSFEPISETHPVESKWNFFKCDHSRQHFVVHRIHGFLPLKVVNFIMNLQTTFRPFYLTRHGQSEYNEVGKIGGDSGLSHHGLQYAHKLAEFVKTRITRDSEGNDVPARLWTSSLQRTIQTAQFIEQPTIFIKDQDDQSIEYEWVQMRPRRWHHLDEVFAGACDGMTYEEIEEKFPEEFELRKVDKLAYRYPRGESYLDVIARLEPIVLEMERHREPLLIVGHQGILRIIYAFYMGLSRAEAPYVSIPLNTVYEMVPNAYACRLIKHILYSPAKSLPKDGQDEPQVDDPPSH